MSTSEIEAPKDSLGTDSDRDLRRWLYWLIAIGLGLRVAQPFIQNPLDWVISDPRRHYLNALYPWSGDIFNITDSPVYQIWLGGVLRICGNSRECLAVYAVILGLLTPWLYYRWFRECLPHKSMALAGFAILSLLPTWIRFNSFFLQETVLLPLVAAGLWMSWRAVRKRDDASIVFAATFWGLAISTKFTSLPLAGMVWVWVVFKVLAANGRRKLPSLALASGLLASLVALGPIKAYNGLHQWFLVPQGDMNKYYYESCNKEAEIIWRYDEFLPPATRKEMIKRFSSPSTATEPFRPFSSWRMPREGTLTLVYQVGSPSKITPLPVMSLEDRLRQTFYNSIYLFWGDTWPTYWKPRTWLDRISPLTRWIWAPLITAVVILAIRRRQVLPATGFCLGFLLCLLVQQNAVMEGRYRMAWEGLAIGALLESLSRPAQRRNHGTVT